MKTVLIVTLLALGIVAVAVAAEKQKKGAPAPDAGSRRAPSSERGVGRIERSEAEWRRILTPAQFHVLREEGTERAFSGEYWNEHRKGAYLCAGCDLELFDSSHKFDSGTGWPSYWRPAEQAHVVEKTDRTFGMVRVEIECARCGGHLGHVFDDGPAPTGQRYCVNSASLRFVPAAKSR